MADLGHEENIEGTNRGNAQEQNAEDRRRSLLIRTKKKTQGISDLVPGKYVSLGALMFGSEIEFECMCCSGIWGFVLWFVLSSCF